MKTKLSSTAGSVLEKKILFVIYSLHGGGAERVTVNLAEQWSKAGAHVTIATLASAKHQLYALPAGVRFLPLDVAGGSRSPLFAVRNNLRRLKRLRRLIVEERPDVVIGMMTTVAVMLALVRTRRIVAIGAERNYPPLQPVGRLLLILRRWVYGRLDVVTVQTCEGSDWLSKYTTARRIAVIPNSIQLPLPQQTPVLPVSNVVAEGRRILLAVGRLAPQKGFDRLIGVFTQIASDYPDWDLVILGEGPQRTQLETQVADAGLQGRILIPGWAGNTADWYLAASLYVMTSLFEGFPNVMVEAMAHNCPVLSVDCDTGPRDIVINGKNGLLVPQGDSAALQQGLVRLMGDDDLRQTLASHASEVCETFSPKRINSLWLELFAPEINRAVLPVQSVSQTSRRAGS